MFDNIGGKIKVVAKVECWIGIISSFIAGISLMSEDEELFGLIGFFVIVIGSLASWLGSFLIYGFGQLVENSDILAGRTSNEDTFMQELEEKSVEDKIFELNELLDKGHISYDEYQQIVKKIEADVHDFDEDVD